MVVALVVMWQLVRIIIRFVKKRRVLRYCIRDIDTLSGEEFERYLYLFYKKHGYRVKLTPPTHDYGADLVVRYRGKKVVIQAKRYSDRVGIKAVQEVIGSMAYYKAKHGMVITNNYYTKSAYELARVNGITLVGRKALIKMINEQRPSIY